MANNRELSQFASFVEVNDTSRHISVASTSGQYVGIGSTLPTAKVDIVGDLKVSSSVTGGNVSISSGIVTAVSGVVTYYGDGSKLNLSSNPSTGIGIGTTGGVVGYGVTFINFFGAGVSTAYYNSSVGIATIYFQGGGGGGGAIGIGSTFPGTPASILPAPANGDLFFHIDYGRTFIYYDEVTLGIGASAFWVDSSPFNIGIITALSGGVAFSDGSAISPSWYFGDDITTGVFSPTNGQLTFVSTGSSVLNINPSGLNVTGVVTATKVYSNGQELLRGVGIATASGTVGTGATIIDFRGAGISTVTVSSGIATVNIEGGGGGGSFSPVNYIIN